MTLSDGGQRLASNYLRLSITFLCGLLVVRLLAEVGPSALNVYLIIVSGTGFAFFMKIVMQESVVPLLGLSYEGQKNRSFEKTYWISFLFGIAASVFALIIFLVLWLFREQFDTGALTTRTFTIALITGALRTTISAMATPPLHAVLITGRIVAYNLFLTVERLVDVIAVALVLWLLSSTSEATMAEGFFLLSALLYCLVQITAGLYASRIDHRFAFRPVAVKARDLQWTKGIFGWNIAIVIAFLLYLRFSTMAVNIAYGEGATLLLGLVFMLIGYQRQISMGLVIGLDAVVARAYGSSIDNAQKKQAVKSIILQSTYVQGVFSFASVTALWILAEPVFFYWLGDSLAGSDWDPAAAATLFRIMSVGVLARSLSESWMKILNGRGLVSTYAPWLLLGGVIYSVALLVWFGIGTQLDTILIRIALSFSTLYVINHIIVIPWLMARENDLRFTSLIGAALFPGSAVSMLFLGLAQAMSPTTSLFQAAAWLTASTLAVVPFLLPRVMRAFLQPLAMTNREITK